jgi:hypothetical protein
MSSCHVSKKELQDLFKDAAKIMEQVAGNMIFTKIFRDNKRIDVKHAHS